MTFTYKFIGSPIYYTTAITLPTDTYLITEDGIAITADTEYIYV
jgi:hypothetical protein